MTDATTPESTPAQKLVAPDAGAIVEYGLNSFGTAPTTWRVKSWLRVAPPLDTAQATWIDEILRESAVKVDTKTAAGKQPMQFCLQEEATHVSLTGICGAIAPIEKCKVLGMVDWPQSQLDEARESAVRIGKSRRLV